MVSSVMKGFCNHNSLLISAVHGGEIKEMGKMFTFFFCSIHIA